LVALLLIGIISHSKLVAAAACILMIFKFTNLNFVFPLLERRGLELGLLFLFLSILVPVACGNVSPQDITRNLTSFHGILAITGGMLATHLNTRGLKLIKLDPEIIFGLVIGSVLGIVLFQGVPVGPLMPAGLAALFINLSRVFR